MPLFSRNQPAFSRVSLELLYVRLTILESMPATTDHPVLYQPSSGEIKIWRYMDFSKYVALLSSESLFFCRADRFDDPYEGAFSKANEEMRPQVYRDMDSQALKAMTADIGGFIKWSRQWTYICCWHENEHESAAMWDLYGNRNNAVAIESTYERLKNELPDNSILGKVKYIDYATEWMPEGNSMYPFFHKRLSFSHEREIRAMIPDLPTIETGFDFGKSNDQPGFAVRVNINQLILRVHLSPRSPKWLYSALLDINGKYGITAQTRKSDLYSDPVF